LANKSCVGQRVSCFSRKVPRWKISEVKAAAAAAAVHGCYGTVAIDDR